MAKPLKVLIAEDNAKDAELLLLALRQAGFDPDWRLVDTERDYASHLSGDLDLIISDYEMPQFSGLRALELLKARGIDVPFIIVSGTIVEDTAIAAMKLGAADYLLKDRLGRLEQAVVHAVEEKRLRLEREEALLTLRESEEKLRHIFDGIPAFIGLFSVDGQVLELNQASLQLAGLGRTDIVGQLFVDGPWWSHSNEMRNRVSVALKRAAQGESVREEVLVGTTDGQFMVVEFAFNPLRDDTGKITEIVGSGVDVTKRKEAEQKIREQLDELLRWQEVMLNREDRIQALKAEVNALLVGQRQPERYRIPSIR